ncbi:MAG: GntR family transcriptional regulator [Acidobacteria bacterium]|nr:MAG: GntR family transcriptional regulator [Acidobacteriota bacterium]
MDLAHLDAQSPVPLYRQLAERIERLIATGALAAGDRIPTVRELAARARVNRNTAARAIQLLESEGLVRTRVGSGTFVADGAKDAGRAALLRAIDRAFDRLIRDAAAAGLPLDSLASRLHRRVELFRRCEEASRPAGEEDR